MAADILMIERAAERLLVVAFGGTSLVLGWALFMKGVVQEQAGSLEIMSWKVQLQKVGPGVFFALFGTVVLVFSLTGKLEVEKPRQSQPSANGKTARETALGVERLSYMINPSSEDQRLAHAINSVLKIDPDFARLSDADKGDFRRAQAVLSDRRDAMAVRALGDREIIPFFKAHDGDPNTASNLADQQRLERAVPWLKETMSFEPLDGR